MIFGLVMERLILNWLVVLSPLYFSNIIIPNVRDMRYRLLGGVLAGIASVSSMAYPIVTESGFQWDLRWIPFLLTALYCGRGAASITFAMIILSRIWAGNMVAVGFACVVAICLTAVLLYVKPKFQQALLREKLLWSTLIACVAYLLVLAAISSGLMIKHNLAVLFNVTPFIHIFMFVTYVSLLPFIIYFVEFIEVSHRLRQQLHENEKMNLVSELSASIAHEVRNPLTVVRGFIQLVKEKMTENDKRYMDIAISEIDRAEAIITDYLNFAKPKRIDDKPFDMTRCLLELVQLMTSYSNLRNVVLEGIVSQQLQAVGDEFQFKQAMLNIVKNAIEATGEEGKVKINAYSKADEQIIIEVRDTGVGMTAEQLERIGNPYFSTKETGTGLGLAVTFHIIREMGGTIQYASHLGYGTLMTMHLPLYVEDIQPQSQWLTYAVK